MCEFAPHARRPRAGAHRGPHCGLHNRRSGQVGLARERERVSGHRPTHGRRDESATALDRALLDSNGQVGLLQFLLRVETCACYACVQCHTPCANGRFWLATARHDWPMIPEVSGSGDLAMGAMVVKLILFG